MNTRNLVRTFCLTQFALLACLTALAAQITRPLGLADYYRLKSASSPVISPDGRSVAYVVTSIIEEENRRHSEIWLATTDGSDHRI